MPIVRFSAIEQQGVLVPQSRIESVANMDAAVLLMHKAGVRPQRVPADTLADITPPYWRTNVSTYWLHTEPGEPVESCIVHIMPKVDGGEMRRLFADGTVGDEPHRTMRIPSESSCLPLLSPDSAQMGMRMHELILPMPDNLIVALGGTAL